MKMFFPAAWLVAMIWAAPPLPSFGQSGRTTQPKPSAVSDAGYARVRVFGIEAVGNKFVWLFDRSASMEGARLAAAKKQLIESLRPLGETQQFDIIFFSHRLQIFNSLGSSHRVTFGTERNKKLAAEFVSAVKADGGTDRMSALKQALALQPDVIFFLSDADRPMSADELDKVAELNDRAGAKICAIEFGHGDPPAGKSSLDTLAKANGGQYVYIDTDKFVK